MTAPQAGMWLDGAGDPSSAKYTIGNYVRLVGDLDVEALYRSIVQTDAESDCAQLRFGQREGTPFQYFAEKAAPTDFAVIDLRHAPDPAAWARREMEAFRLRPFDKVAGPLCGHRLLRLDDREHWWFRSYSHLITDGLSSHLLAERTAQIYNATGAEPPPEPWFGRYTDFIAEEKAYPGSAAHERDIAYWRQRLASNSEVTRFKSGNGTTGTEIGELLAGLDPDRMAGLQALAERSKASLAAVAMALYYLLLGRMAGTLRPTAFTPFGNRLGRRERATPGAFAFVLPFTVDLDGKHTLGELARDIFGQLRRDMRHMRLAPIRMRAAALGRNGLSSGTGASANVIGVVPPLSFDGLSASVVNFYTGPTPDVSLIFVGEELGDGRTRAYLHWRYNSVLYTRAEVARIAGRFDHLLDSVLAAPEGPLAELTVTPEAGTATVRGCEANPAQPTAPSTRRLTAQQHRLQQEVARIWGKLIGAEEIDPQANLFEIGAHSLLVPRAQHLLEEIAGRAVGAVEIFEHPTVAAFARHLAGSGPEPAPRQQAASDDCCRSGENAPGDTDTAAHPQAPSEASAMAKPCRSRERSSEQPRDRGVL